MRILGIDPGYGRTGWGVIEGNKSTWAHVAHGCLETSVEDPFVERLKEIQKMLRAIIQEYAPAQAAVEELFFYKNVKTAIKVGQARGVILLTLADAGLPIGEYTPLEVKQTITGYGRADKRQLTTLIRHELHLKTDPTPDDAADALAIALAHAYITRLGCG